jgi:hypothetical protein
MPAPGRPVAVAAEQPVLVVNTVCYLDPIRRCAIEDRGLGRMLEDHECAVSTNRLSGRQPEFASNIDEGASRQAAAMSGGFGRVVR